MTNVEGFIDFVGAGMLMHVAGRVASCFLNAHLVWQIISRLVLRHFPNKPIAYTATIYALPSRCPWVMVSGTCKVEREDN